MQSETASLPLTSTYFPGMQAMQSSVADETAVGDVGSVTSMICTALPSVAATIAIWMKTGQKINEKN